MTVAEAAEKLGVSQVTMLRYLQHGTADNGAKKIGRVWEIDRVAVEKLWLWRQTHKPGRPRQKR